MTHHASLASRFLLSLSLAVAASTTACANVIVSGGESSDGSGGSTSSAAGTEPPVPPGASGSGTTTSPQAIAIPYKYIYGSESGGNGTGGNGSTTSSSSSSSGGADDTDERLFLEVGNEARSCTNSRGSFKCGTWSLSIGLQPAFQHPGTYTVQSDNETVGGTFFESEESTDSSGFCSGGGGSAGPGVVVTIVEINETHVVFTVQGIDRFAEYFAVDGTYDAPRCGS